MDGGSQRRGRVRAHSSLTFGVNRPRAGYHPTSIDHCLQLCFPARRGLVGEDHDSDAAWACKSATFRESLSHRSLKKLRIVSLDHIDDTLFIFLGKRVEFLC